MTVYIKLFASLRESEDTGDMQIDFLTLPKPAKARDVWQLISTTQKIDTKNIFCAINHEHASMDSIISDNDEVAFFPPITGG